MMCDRLDRKHPRELTIGRRADVLTDNEAARAPPSG